MSMGGGESRTVTTQELSPEQRALIAPVIPIAKRQLANPPQMFPGTGITGFTPLQQQAQQMTVAAANQMAPITGQIPNQFSQLMQRIPQVGQQIQTGAQQAGGAANVAASAANRQVQQMVAGLQPGTNFLTSGAVLRPESNPALQAAIQAASRPAVQTFREQVMPSITQGGISSGGFGGTRQGIAEGIAGRGVQQTVGDIGAQMANVNYQAGLQAMLGGLGAASEQQRNILAGGGQQAETALGAGQLGVQGGAQNLAAQQLAAQTLGQAGNVLGQTLLPAQLKESVGMQQQQLQQAQLSERVQKFVNEQMIPFAVAQDVASMAFGMPGGTTRSTSTQPGNPMAGIQAGLGGLSLLPALFAKSDRRLKYAIRTLKKLVDGLTLYVFKYIGEIQDRLGFMADEVEQLYPEAVRIEKDGYKRVKYIEVPTWYCVGMRS